MGICKGIRCAYCRHWKRDGISVHGFCCRTGTPKSTNDGECCENAALKKEIADYLYKHYDQIKVLAGIDDGEAPIDTSMYRKSDVVAITEKYAVWEEVDSLVKALPTYRFPADKTSTVEISLEEYNRLKENKGE